MSGDKKKIGPFDWVKSITNKTVIDNEYFNQYNPFLTNRSLSNFYDCVLYANEMNRFWQLDNDIQFCFLNSVIKKGKRYAKWEKKDTVAHVEVIKNWYKVNNQRAMEILTLLTPDQIGEIEKKLCVGGRFIKR